MAQKVEAGGQRRQKRPYIGSGAAVQNNTGGHAGSANKAQTPVTSGGTANVITNTNISKDVLKVGEFQYTRSAGNHALDVIKKGDFKGELARPFLKSQQTINEIISKGGAIPDPGGVPGALRYDVSGSFRGVVGEWELVIDPKSKIIYHFNFVRNK